MRLVSAVLFLFASSVAAFAPASRKTYATVLKAVEVEKPKFPYGASSWEEARRLIPGEVEPPDCEIPVVIPAEYNAKLEAQLAKLRERDSKSIPLKKEDLKILLEDDHIVAVNKPSGTLCCPTPRSEDDFPTLSKLVFETIGCDMGRMDKMIVHRLGMETSGVVVFAKTMPALRNMNMLLRTQKVTRHYEALLCGHLEQDEGIIDLPLMRDYECPPYIRVSTLVHQHALMYLLHEDVGKQLLENPKKSRTKYEVVAREELNGQPVTRVILTSITGRTHQLNVHCAAFGHPIVGDTTYGLGGEALPNGGLTDEELEELIPNPARVTEEQQKAIFEAAAGLPMCIHAKTMLFRHPLDKKIPVSVTAPTPF